MVRCVGLAAWVAPRDSHFHAAFFPLPAHSAPPCLLIVPAPLPEQHILLQEALDRGPEGGDRLALAPAVTLALVDVVLVRDAASAQGLDDQVRLGARDDRIDRALEDRDRVG